MLVLSRRTGEEIIVANHIVVRVIAINGGAVRLGIEAPKDVLVDRKEIHDLRATFDAPVEHSATCRISN